MLTYLLKKLTIITILFLLFTQSNFKHQNKVIIGIRRKDHNKSKHDFFYTNNFLILFFYEMQNGKNQN